MKWSPGPPPQPVVRGTADSISYNVTVTNTGKVTGDEVVFVYVKPQASSLATLPKGTPVEIKRLAAYKRVHLEPNQSITLQFTVDAKAFSMVDVDGHRSLHAGDFDVTMSRGHGEELVNRVTVKVDEPVRLATFRKWW